MPSSRSKKAAARHQKKLKKRTERGKRPYAPNWFGLNGIAAKSCRLTGGICICCMKAKATISHHFYYLTCFGQKIYGLEIAGISCGGVCARCHGWLHSDANWVYDDNNPDKDHNTSAIVMQLRMNFWLLFLLHPFIRVFQFILNWLMLAVLVCLAVIILGLF